MTRKTHFKDIPSYVTQDGSIIRELMHPGHHSVQNQSLAESRVPVGERTRKHWHKKTEEPYHITHGKGLMALGD